MNKGRRKLIIDDMVGHPPICEYDDYYRFLENCYGNGKSPNRYPHIVLNKKGTKLTHPLSATRPVQAGARLLGWLALLGAGAFYLDFSSSLVVLELALLVVGLYTVLAVDGQAFLWGWRHRKELRPVAISVTNRKYFWLVHKGIATKIADTTTYQETQDPAFRMVLQQWTTYCLVQLFEAMSRGDVDAAKSLVTYVADADRYEMRQVAVYAQRHNALVKGFRRVALPPGRWYMRKAVDAWQQQLASA